MKPMDYHDYIWDLGGTLLDNYEVSTQAFLDTLEVFGLKADYESVYLALRTSRATAVKRYAPDIPDFLNVYKEKERLALENPKLCLGARACLENIKQSGARQFLVSHRDQQVLELLDRLGIKDYFTEVVTSQNGFERKPSPEAFLYLKSKYQIREALVIGDRDIDQQAGQKAGFDTLLVDNNKSLLEQIR